MKERRTHDAQKATLKALQINVITIPPEGLQMSQACDVAQLDVDIPHIHIAGPLSVMAKVLKGNNTVTVDARIEARAKMVCGRCLEEFERELKRDAQFHYQVEPKTRILDITEEVRQEVILEYPLKVLCKPDCKGLCPQCGENLNLGPCLCK